MQKATTKAKPSRIKYTGHDTAHSFGSIHIRQQISEAVRNAVNGTISTWCFFVLENWVKEETEHREY